MSKPNKQNTQNTTPAPASTPAESAPVAAESAPAEAVAEVVPATETGITVTGGEAVTEAPSELVATSALLKKYQAALPAHAQYLSQVTPPNRDELSEAIEVLPSANKAAMVEAFSRMNPVKVGQHTAKRDFSLPDIRIYHGTGTDEQRPGDCPTGGIYSTDGRVLAAPKEALANLRFNPKHTNLKEVLSGYVIGVHEAATFWPPRNAPPPEGVEVRNNMPICRSIDRERGDYFGSCKSCVYLAFKDGKPNKDACRNEDHVYVVLADFSGVYRIVVSGTSVKPGSRAVKTKSKSWSSYYAHAFDFDARAETQGTNRWFELNANVSSAPDPTPEQTAVLNILARQIDFQIYYPTLYRIYSTEPKMSQKQGSTADMDDLLKKVGGGAPAPGAGPAASATQAAKKDVSGNL